MKHDKRRKSISNQWRVYLQLTTVRVSTINISPSLGRLSSLGNIKSDTGHLAASFTEKFRMTQLLRWLTNFPSGANIVEKFEKIRGRIARSSHPGGRVFE